ncbi:hypothetical protein [Thermococcus sp.]
MVKTLKVLLGGLSSCPLQKQGKMPTGVLQAVGIWEGGFETITPFKG